MIKVFTPDKNGKISFTVEELQKLVEEAHAEGFKEGQKTIERYYYYPHYYPYYPSWWSTITTSNGIAEVTLNTSVGDVQNGTVLTDGFKWGTNNGTITTSAENKE